MSNAKRALHFQIDLISDALGFNVSGQSNASFPAKLDFCVRCGVVGPAILRKLNRMRNAMEHEYYIPTRDEAETFVDVVELFLSATDRFVYDFPTELSLQSAKHVPDADVHTEYVHIELEPGTGKVRIQIKRLNVTLNELHLIAANEKKALQKEMAEKERQNGIKTVFVGGIEAAAYAGATRDRYEKTVLTVSASDGQDYFSWVSVLTERS